MNSLFERIIPNVLNNSEELLRAIKDTLIMVSVSGIISIFLGLIIGVILVVTKEDGILENKFINMILEKVISIFRSIPFIILLAALLPLTRIIVGTSIGTKGAIVPLVFGTIPFLAKQIENALVEVNPGLIEAAESMGSNPLDIILRVYLKEGLAGIIRGISITLISLIGLSAMAGNIGGGGLGDFAIRYGYAKSQHDITYTTIVIILIIVLIIQKVSDILIEQIRH